MGELPDDWPDYKNFDGNHPWVIVNGKEGGLFKCLRCKASQEPEFPVDIKVFLKQMDDFIDAHKDCKESE